MKTPLLVTPGSEQVRATIERDGLLADLEAIGATVLANACGPCIGQWHRDDIDDGAAQHDRHLLQPQLPDAQRRQRGARSPSYVARDWWSAYALAGTLDFDPLARRRSTAMPSLEPPVGDELPAAGLRRAARPASSPRRPTARTCEVVGAARQRPAPAARAVRRRGTANDLEDLRVLLKAKGKCTTDHISPAGPVAPVPRAPREHLRQPLHRRGQRVQRTRPGHGLDGLRRRRSSRSPTSPSTYKEPGMAWVAVGDENYGEGSSREHAAMEPRFMGGAAIIVRSFARIHEANLKKQGVLPLDVRRPRRLRPGRARTTASRSSGSPTSPPTHRCACASTTPTARRRHSSAPTPCRRSTSSGSGPAPRSTSSAGSRSTRARLMQCTARHRCRPVGVC